MTTNINPNARKETRSAAPQTAAPQKQGQQKPQNPQKQANQNPWNKDISGKSANASRNINAGKNIG